MKLLVGSYNIFHGEDHDLRSDTGEHVIDLARTAETIRGLGVALCGLNEVRNQSGAPGLCNQAAEIAAKLGWHYAFAKAIDIEGGEYGNALVSRYPIRTVRTLPITTTAQERGKGKYEDRVLLIAEIEAEDRTLTVMVCHFGLNRIEMEKAAACVIAEAQKCDTPLLFMGDLNLTPGNDIYGMLARALTDTMPSGEGENFTFSRRDPDRKIDYIFANSRVRTLGAEVHDVGISDHRPITAEVEF